MKVEKTSYLKIPFDWLFSIYVFFLVAVIVRYLWILSHLLRGKDPEAPTRPRSAPACESHQPLLALRHGASSPSPCSGCRSGTP